MVFIHPVILKDRSITASYTSDKYNYIRAKQMDMREGGISLMYDDVTPILPEMEELLKLPPSFEDYQQQQQSTAPPTIESIAPPTLEGTSSE